MSNKFTGITSAGSAIPVYDKDAHSALSQKLDTTALAPAIEAAVSGKQDAGDYYSASNPSGFISSVPETYLQNTDLTVSDGKVTEISGIPLSAGGEVPEGVMVESAVGFNAVNEISGYNGSAIAQFGAEKQWLVHDDTLVHASNSAQYALGVNLSAVAQLLGVDETVLWSGTLNTTGGSYQMADSIQNFDKIKVYGKWNGNYAVSRGESVQEFTIDDPGQAQLQYYPVFSNILSNVATQNIVAMYFYSDKTFNLGAGTKFTNGTATTGISTYDFNVTRVVGIGRKS